MALLPAWWIWSPDWCCWCSLANLLVTPWTCWGVIMRMLSIDIRLRSHTGGMCHCWLYLWAVLLKTGCPVWEMRKVLFLSFPLKGWTLSGSRPIRMCPLFLEHSYPPSSSIKRLLPLSSRHRPPTAITAEIVHCLYSVLPFWIYAPSSDAETKFILRMYLLRNIWLDKRAKWKRSFK